MKTPRRSRTIRDSQLDRVRHVAQSIFVIAGVSAGSTVGLLAHGATKSHSSTVVPPTSTSTTTTTAVAPTTTTTPSGGPAPATTTTLYIPPTTAPVTTSTVCYSTPSGNTQCY